MYLKNFFLLALFASSASTVMSSKVLLAPFPYRSHIIQHEAIGSELKSRGHTIYMMLPVSYPNVAEIKEKFLVVTYKTIEEDMYTAPSQHLKAAFGAAITMTPIQFLQKITDAFIQMCTNPLEDEDFFRELFELRIDLALVDAFPHSRCYFILMHNLNIAYVSLITQYEPWVWKTPVLPSFVPFPLVGAMYSDRMSFIERVQNLWTLLQWSAFPKISVLEDDFVKKYIKPDSSKEQSTFASLNAKSQLWFIDTDWALEFPRPLMPNEINMGGLVTQPAKPLIGEFKTYADGASSHGLIIATFGTIDVLTKDIMDKFLTAFSLIKQKVLLRYTGEITQELKAKIPKNLFISQWLPQNDILGHPNTQLFITHGGSNGQFEALYHAVPTITFPLFSEQPHNALRMTHLGGGLTLNIRDFTAEQLVWAINEILTNNSYRENIARRSAIFHDQGGTPRQRAARWIEYVLKHGGSHLHSHALDMPWYEYLMIDMLIVLVVFPVMVLTFLFTSMFYLVRGRMAVSSHKEKIH